MSIDLSPDQSKALDLIMGWYEDRIANVSARPFFTLHGLAGTGKTTLARHIADAVGGAVFAAYTGKAAHVLRSKGCPASTIHGLIYLPTTEKEAEAQRLRDLLEKTTDAKEQASIYRRLDKLSSPSFTLRDKSQSRLLGAKLLILDECSMVDESIADDLLSYNVPILTLGDPGQLPPIEGQGYFDTSPDYTLTEIHRQAKESPIIQLALMAREGRALPRGKHGDCEVISMRGITEQIALSHEQIIVGSNKARAEMNAHMRKLLGRTSKYPEPGERLICLRNNPLTGLMNGQIVEVESCTQAKNERRLDITLKDPSIKVSVWGECFTDPKRLLAMPYYMRKTCDEFDYGYAITGHKSQGSQFDSVLVYADMFKWNPDLYKRWLYTAITRAAKKVTVAA